MESGAGEIRRDVESIEAHILEYLRREIISEDRGEVGLEDNLFVGGLIDSVGVVRLVGHIQQTYEITVPAPDLIPQNFRTVRVMAAYLDGLLTG